jgi:hypothetical protein
MDAARTSEADGEGGGRARGPQDRAELDSRDRRIVDGVGKALADARQLEAWWQEADRDGAYRETFELSATHNRPDRSFGFFDTATVGGQRLPILGIVQEQFFDRPKASGGHTGAGAASRIRDQVEEFVLRYFLRVSDYAAPTAFPGERGTAPPRWLRPLSWAPDPAEESRGFGYEMAYVKRPGERARKVSGPDRFRIVDLRELGTTYEWIVVKVVIYGFDFRLAPLGRDNPYGTLPMTGRTYLALAPELIVGERDPGAAELGRYGLGYAFLEDPDDGALAYGPGRFRAGLKLIRFHVRASGEVFSRLIFVADRPRDVMNVSLDPIRWGVKAAEVFSLGMPDVVRPLRRMARGLPRLPGFDPVRAYISLANLATLGEARRRLKISKKQLEKIFMAEHFMQHYNMISGALVTWRQVPDWLDTEALPEWVRSGVSS